MNPVKQFILNELMGEEDDEEMEDFAEEDMRDMRRTRMDMAGRSIPDSRSTRDMVSRNRSMRDGRRGVPGSGRMRRDRSHSKRLICLSNSELREWRQNLENADGSDGPCFDNKQIMQAAQRAGINFEDYTEREFCTAVNVFYSDFCEAAAKYIGQDKMLMFCIDMVRAALEDDDGPSGSEKMAMYYYTVVCDG